MFWKHYFLKCTSFSNKQIFFLTCLSSEMSEYSNLSVISYNYSSSSFYDRNNLVPFLEMLS